MTAKIFKNSRNQAVRIPVEFSFSTDTVTIEAHGDALIVRPKYEAGWDRFFEDESLVLPHDFDTREDLAPPECDSTAEIGPGR